MLDAHCISLNLKGRKEGTWDPGSTTTPTEGKLEGKQSCRGLWPEKGPGKAQRPCQQGCVEGPEGEVGPGLKGGAEEARADRGGLDWVWGPWSTIGKKVPGVAQAESHLPV